MRIELEDAQLLRLSSDCAPNGADVKPIVCTCCVALRASPHSQVGWSDLPEELEREKKLAGTRYLT